MFAAAGHGSLIAAPGHIAKRYVGAYRARDRLQWMTFGCRFRSPLREAALNL